MCKESLTQSFQKSKNKNRNRNFHWMLLNYHYISTYILPAKCISFLNFMLQLQLGTKVTKWKQKQLICVHACEMTKNEQIYIYINKRIYKFFNICFLLLSALFGVMVRNCLR